MPQRWYQKASVQVAIVSGIFFVVIAGMEITSRRSGLERDNERYRSELSEKDETIQRLQQENRKLTGEVQRLETLLTPFRTLALDRFTGSESEVLQKLAEQIDKLHASDLEKSEAIDRLEKELEETKGLAEPNTIILDSKTIERVESGYSVRLCFRPSKADVALARLDFSVGIPVDSEQTLLTLEPGCFSAMVKTRISDDGKAGRVTYTPLSDPCLAFTVSGPTQAQIRGNLGLQTLILDIR